MLELVLLLTFIDIILFIYLIYTYLSSRRIISGRMKHFLNPEKNREKPDKEKGMFLRDGLFAFGKTIEKSRIGNRYKEKLEIRLAQAHLPLKPEEFIALSIIMYLTVFAIVLILSENAAAATLLAMIAVFTPQLYINSRRKSIIHKIDQQLPDTLALISNTLKSGYSFLQAVDAASKELPPPVSLEFQQILKEINLGVNTEKALEDLSKRVLSQDLELIIMAVLIQRQIGGNLSEILDSISETIRSRIKIKGEIKVLTAQGRISGLVISLLPIALGFIIYIINPEYIMLLFQHPIGWALLALAFLMQCTGIFLVRKIVRIEV